MLNKPLDKNIIYFGCQVKDLVNENKHQQE